MKKFLGVLVLCSLMATFSSCEKDEGKNPNISFKSGGSYTSSSATVARGSAVTMGITASKSEKKDVLKKFNISKSVNGGSAVTVFSKDLSGGEEDDYNYDYNATLDTTHFQTSKFTFTVTNRDGLTNQVSLTLTND